jgi:hypothetical protein
MTNAPFIPRPEADAFPPGQPLEPVKKAVEKLLRAIKGTIEAKGNVAHCFVVAGERGTGKTTVLKTANKWCQSGVDENAAENGEWRDLGKRLRWLDVLDVEPLQPTANLLTILLVAIRNTLGDAGTKRRSLLEDGGSSACAELDELINDAALIWEEIREHSTREVAERQIVVGEAYLEFDKRLARAMKAAGTELASREARPVAKVFVVPIDNVDRSAEHLEKIFKLAQLVTCEHLCLVLAADRTELSLFLERAYWNEATRGTTQPKYAREEDEALSLAHRQAAATLRKILPPNNRIEVDLLNAEQALQFSPGAGPSLRDLFEKLVIVREKEDARTMHLLKFFETKRKPTELGHEALQLSARALLDLWLLAKAEVAELADGSDEPIPIRHALRVVRAMLRLTVAESKMPHWATELVQDRIITRTARGDAEGDTRFVLGVRGGPSHVEVRRFRAETRTLRLSQQVLVRAFTRHEFMMTIHDGENRAMVGQPMLAWFLVLYDLLVLAPELLVINSPPDFLQGCAPRIETVHTAWFEHHEVSITCRWPLPRWETVLECMNMEDGWSSYVQTMPKPSSELSESKAAEALPGVMWQWINIALSVGGGDRPPSMEHDPDLIRKNLKETEHPAVRRWIREELPRFATGEFGVALDLELPNLDMTRAMHPLHRMVARALRETLSAAGEAADPKACRTWVDQTVAEILVRAEGTRARAKRTRR